MPVSKKTVYLYPCECGDRIDVCIGQAGQEVTCPNCKRSTRVESLSKLKKRKSVERTQRNPPFLQFSLFRLTLLAVPVAILASIANKIGMEPVGLIIFCTFCYGALAVALGYLIHNSGRIRRWFWEAIQND